MTAKWDDALYEKRKEEKVQEVNVKYASLVEWVEQPLPASDGAIRALIKGSGEPFLPSELVEQIPAKAVPETGKLSVLA